MPDKVNDLTKYLATLTSQDIKGIKLKINYDNLVLLPDENGNLDLDGLLEIIEHSKEGVNDGR